jgi:metal-dependent hydrolase (beta-lactamase superfamily II)
MLEKPSRNNVGEDTIEKCKAVVITTRNGEVVLGGCASSETRVVMICVW